MHQEINVDAKIALIGIPHDENSSFMRGAAEAPPLIREALHSDATNLWSEQGIDLGSTNVLHDAGDLDLPKSKDPLANIQSAVTDLLAQGSAVLSLGGDHAITLPVIRAYRQIYERLHILHFDAHPDLYETYEANRHSHACPFARIMEEGLAQHLVQVGIRTMNGHQKQQAERFGVQVIEMKNIDTPRILSFDAPLYISFDIDVLDPAHAPGVSHFEPGGLSTRQAIQIIQEVQAPAIVGADIVEFNPRRDTSGRTASVCAKLLKEIASRMVEGI
jgi:agmatinase